MAGNGTKRLLENLRKHASGALPGYVSRQRWFGGKARPIRDVRLVDVVPVMEQRAFVLFVEVRYQEGPKETYVLPLAELPGGEQAGAAGILQATAADLGPGAAFQDALRNEEFLHTLMDAVARARRMPGLRGEIRATRGSMFETLHGPLEVRLAPIPLKAEQSNTSINFGHRLILKVFRRLQLGVNPELEIGRFLTETAHFTHAPAVAGSFEYATKNGKTMTVGILQAYVPNQGNAWEEALQRAAAFYEQVAGRSPEMAQFPQPGRRSLLALADQPLSPEALDLAGPYLDAARLLGQRTAELHVALASTTSDDAFTPEPFTPAFRRKLAASLRGWRARTLRLLAQKESTLPERWRAAADRVVGAEAILTRRTKSALGKTLTAMRTRIHGDYHLGQVLRSGDDFVIIDFEGEPARSIEERRIKRSPLQDVAGMLRSFHYAAYVPLLQSEWAQARSETSQALDRWALWWWECLAGCFLKAYLETSGSSRHIPSNRAELAGLLDFHLIEKAIYELYYELNNRPEWVSIPLRGIDSLLATEQ
jgi:trehalose synthase-fused probable maltokinase